MPMRGLGLQTQQPQQLDDVARGATYVRHLQLGWSVTQMIDRRAPHTQKLHTS